MPAKKRAPRDTSPLQPRAGLPIGCRLPNPPALFVGRAAELKALGDAVQRAPVTVVHGEGGIGKSALTLSFLHKKHPERVPGTVFASLRGADPLEPVALNVTRALVLAAGLRDVGWSELLGAPDALGALALDLAEERSFWIVLDDLHHGDPDQVRALLAQLARYARRSRWIATTRTAPAADALRGQLVSLDAMKPVELLRLARALYPSSRPEALRRALAGASGSPWRLRQMDASGAPAQQGAREDHLGGVAPETLTFLQALGMLDVPLPRSVALRLEPQPAEPLEALERRGLLDGGGEGVRLHELTRESLPRPSDTPYWRAWRARTGAALAGSGAPALELMAVRLLVEAGRDAEAAAALDAAGDALLAAGYAASLWHLLERTAAQPGSARLERWRLRCAVELADAEVLASARPPADGAPEHRFLWARLLLAKSRMAEAAALAAEVRAAAVALGDADLGFRAGLLEARAVGNAGDLVEADRLLDALQAPSVAAAVERDALHSMALALAGARDRALAFADAARRDLSELSWPMRGRAIYGVARALSVLGRLADARELLDAPLGDGGGDSARFDVGRGIRFARLGLAIDAGDLDRGRRELDQLEPYVGRTSLLRPYFVNARAQLALAAGELEDFDGHLADLSAGSFPAQLGEEVAALALRARILRRESPGAPAVEAPVEGRSIFADLGRIQRVERDVRAGVLAPAEAIALLGAGFDNPELQVSAGIARAVARLVAGDAEQALAEATAAAGDAHRSGLGVREAEARQVLCEVLVVLGRREALARAARDLADRAAALPSARFALAARLHAVLAGEGTDAGALEVLAGAWSSAPDVALRARALLGGDVPCDAVDDRVLAALARTGWRVPALVSPPAARWEAGWGIDEIRRDVWLPDGRRVDLSRHPVQWKLLGHLADRGGAATKEDLILAVWGERDYHPLRHDNRLQAAARKLRCEIEDDPGQPRRVLTASDGYALGGTVRRLSSPLGAPRS